MFVDGARTPMSPGVYNPTHDTALGSITSVNHMIPVL